MTDQFQAMAFDISHLILIITALTFLILFLTTKKKLNNSLIKNTRNTAAADTTLKVETPGVETPAPVATARPVLKETGPEAALQLLTLLQQDARFIDFIHEDLTGFSDADVGAAARVVHEGSKKALNNYFEFSPVRSEEEESRITLAEGFNASEVTLTGNVTGRAPFTGTLIHKGWKVTETKLPKVSEGHDTSIVAPAEVEL